MMNKILKWKNDKGQAIVEFAIVIPIFLLFVVGIMDLSWLALGQIQITNATQEAARYYATTENIGVTRADINTVLKDVVVENVDVIDENTISVVSGESDVQQIYVDVTADIPSLTHFLYDSVTISKHVVMHTNY